MSGRKVTRKGEGTEEEKEKRDGTRRRSAQPPITRCQRRQAVIRRLNSRSSRSVFVRVNLHQVSIFRAFRREAGRREARRGDANGANAGGVSAPKRRRAKSTVTATVINNTSKNNGWEYRAGRTSQRLKITLRDVSPVCTGKYLNKFSYKSIEPIE